MELLISVLLGFAGAVIAHVAAHDISKQVPRWAAKLIARAARKLPAPVSDRYKEEWLAHLHECSGVIPKFLHALECFLCARALGRVCSSHEGEVEFQIHGVGSILLDYPTGIFAAELVKIILARSSSVEEPLGASELEDLIDGIISRQWGHAGDAMSEALRNLKPEGLRNFANLLKRAAGGCQLTCRVNGKFVDLRVGLS